MDLLYRGKTKDVFTRPDGNLEFHFKDDATGYVIDGKPVFNSGYDKVVGQIPGKGKISCQFTKYFFELFEEKGYSRRLHIFGKALLSALAIFNIYTDTFLYFDRGTHQSFEIAVKNLPLGTSVATSHPTLIEYLSNRFTKNLKCYARIDNHDGNRKKILF